MEAVGAAASGIAIGQLCFGIAKAIRLWREIEDVPSDLRDAVDRLDALGPVLQDMLCRLEDDPDVDFLPAQHARSCAAYAGKAHRALSELVLKLEGSLQSRGRVRRKMRLAWAALQSDEVAKLERRLDSAVGMVLMCVGCYDRAIMQASHNRIAERTAAKIVSEQKVLHQLSEERIARKISFDVSTQLATLSRQLTAMSSQQPYHEKAEHRTEYVIVRSESCWRGAKLPSYRPSATGKLASSASRDRREWSLSVQLPAWMSRAVWEVQLCWSVAGGWQQSLRSFSIRSTQSAIFAVVARGDVSSMMEMFCKGEASPLDRDEKGSSLVYYATFSEQVDTCRALLDLGLEYLIDDKDTTAESPLSRLVTSRKNLSSQKASNHSALVSLFRSRSDKIDTLGVERMFEFETECSYADDWLRVFQHNFLPGYHDLPLRERAEAVRLGAFTTQDVGVYRALLREDSTVSGEDVRESAEAGFSLVHSAAMALGKRFADEMQFNPRLGRENPDEDDGFGSGSSLIRMRSYNEDWSQAVTDTVICAADAELHRIETVVPWDWYRVPAWTGTPLISVLGGALCRISPGLPLAGWDAVLQSVLRRWVKDVKAAGVDLLRYGRDEALRIKVTETQVKGAFDADAIAASRTRVRNTLRMREAWMQAVDEDYPRRGDDLYWLPVRIVRLDYGPLPGDWRVWWAPEFEVFAAEFWASLDRPRSVMPGSWVDS